MMQFQSHTAKAFQAMLADTFLPGTLAFIQYPDTRAVTAGFAAYTRDFMAANSAKLLAAIALPDPAIVPYLTVRSNILINGQHNKFALLPANLRKDDAFLDSSAKAITPTQSLYIQLFRGLVAGRGYLLMQDFPDTMTLQERRLFLAVAKTAVQKAHACLILLTTDANLVSANPDTSWQTPPDLLARAAQPATN